MLSVTLALHGKSVIWKLFFFQNVTGDILVTNLLNIDYIDWLFRVCFVNALLRMDNFFAKAIYLPDKLRQQDDIIYFEVRMRCFSKKLLIYFIYILIPFEKIFPGNIKFFRNSYWKCLNLRTFS